MKIHPTQRLLDQLRARSVTTMLEELAATVERAKAGEGDTSRVPLTTFHLATGRDVRGWLLALEPASTKGRAVLVQIASSQGTRTHDVSYLDVSVLEALTVHNAADAIEVLSFGDVERPPSEPPPGKLALRRRTTELAHSLTTKAGRDIAFEVGWDTLAGEDDISMHSLQQLIEDTHHAVLDLIDEFGAADVFEKAAGVRIEEGQAAGVRLHDQRIVIGALLGKGRNGRLDREELVRQMQAVL